MSREASPSTRVWSAGRSARRPLAETVELAAVLRDLMGTALALEQPSEELRTIVAELAGAQRRLAAQLPADLAPASRRRRADPARRVYLDHSRDVGDYNACFPRYELDAHDDRAEGRVEFPTRVRRTAGRRPRRVPGGVLRLRAPAAQLRHGPGGQDTQPRPPLPATRADPHRAAVVAHRTITDGAIQSSGELRLDGTVLCEAEMTAVLGDRAALPVVSPRRPA